MSYLSDIKSKLSIVADKHGISGTSVDLAIDLLANAIYTSKVNNLAIISSNSIDTTRNVNSAIQYALTNLYHVYRGRNSLIRIYGKVTSDIKLNRGDKVLSSQNYNVYSLYDVNFNKNYNRVEINGELYYYIDLIVANSFGYKEIEPNDAIGYYVELLENNISEDVFIKTYDNNNWNELNYTSELSIHSDSILNYDINSNESTISVSKINEGGYLPLLLTSYDYGCRLYCGELANKDITVTDFDDKGNKSKVTINRNCIDTIKQTKFRFEYFKFSSNTPTNQRELLGIRIPGFEISDMTNAIKNYLVDNDDIYNSCINQNELVDGNKAILYTNFNPREIIDEGLLYRINTNLVSSQKIRSNYDISRAFLDYFKYYSNISCSTIINKNNIEIYYLINNDPAQIIPQSELNKFKNIQLKYLVWFLEDGSNSIDINISTVIYPELTIDIVSEVSVDSESVLNSLMSLSGTTNRDVTVDEVIGMINSISNVKYCVPKVTKRRINGVSENLTNGKLISADENGKILVIDKTYINLTNTIKWN